MSKIFVGLSLDREQWKEFYDYYKKNSNDVLRELISEHLKKIKGK